MRKISTSNEKNHTLSKKSKISIIVASVIVVLALAGFLYYYFFGNGIYKQVSHTNEVLSNSEIEVTFLQAEYFTSMPGVECDENYVYVRLYYSVKNISDKDISWKSYPYVSINEFIQSAGGYREVKNTECEYDFTALQTYALALEIDFTTIIEDLPAGQTRYDADIIKIPKDDFENNLYFVMIDNIHAIVEINEENSDIIDVLEENLNKNVVDDQQENESGE